VRFRVGFCLILLSVCWSALGQPARADTATSGQPATVPAPAAASFRFRFSAEHLEIVPVSSDGGKPAEVIGRLPLRGSEVAWVRQGKVLYIALAPSGIVFVDLSDPRGPAELYRLEDERVAQLTIRRGKLLGRRYSGSSVLYDVSNPRRPVRLDRPRPPISRRSGPVVGSQSMRLARTANSQPERSLHVGLTGFPAGWQTIVSTMRVDLGTEYIATNGLWLGGRVALLFSSIFGWRPTANFTALLGGSQGFFGAGLLVGATASSLFDDSEGAGAMGTNTAALTGAAVLGVVLRLGYIGRSHARLSLEWSLNRDGAVMFIPMNVLSLHTYDRTRRAILLQGDGGLGFVQLGYEYRF
jgi:hypothetical protein